MQNLRKFCSRRKLKMTWCVSSLDISLAIHSFGASICKVLATLRNLVSVPVVNVSSLQRRKCAGGRGFL